MRRTTATHLILVVGAYVAVTLALLAWGRVVLQRAAWGVMESTAQLVSMEIASALHDNLEDLLSTPTEETSAKLASIVELVERSATVLEATVVNDDGRVLASTRNDPPAALETPAALFAHQRMIRIESKRDRPLDRGRFVVDVPIQTGDQIDGYIRLHLTSDRLEAIVSDSYLVVLGVAVVGLLAIAAVVFSLHLRYSRALQRLMSALTRHDGDIDELDASVDTALRTAEGLHRRMADAESERQNVRERLDTLAETLDIGIVLVDRERNVEVASERAVSMLEELDLAGQDEDPVEAVVRRLEPMLEESRASGRRPRCVLPDVDVDAERRIQVEVTTVERSGTEGWLIQLRDRRGVQAVARDLLEAARARSMAQLFLGVTHDLKAPLNAMVLTVENLRARSESMAQPADERETTLEILSALESEAHRLERALEAVFAHTMTAASRPGRFDLVDVVETTADLVASQARQQGVRFELHMPDDGPVGVVAAKDHIRQAVLNLAVNALEELEDGDDGELIISP